jgi:hypothetical protein
MRKELGKIKHVKCGFGGYQDAMLGINFELGGDGWGVNTDFYGTWATFVKCDERCKWTEKDRDEEYAKALRKLGELLSDAKVRDISELKGIPIECSFDANKLVSWRVLKEVL